jgi:DNA-binding FadR family transcriptional regulator
MNEAAVLRPVDGGSLVTQAVQAVRDHIRANDLKVGDTLPGEGQFSAKLGVSRAVMREAFGALAALKLIDVGNGRRARVGAIDGSVMAASLDHAVATSQVTLAEIWEVRQTLELKTAALAAKNRTDEEARQILALAEAMEQDGEDREALAAHDIAFHQAIARATRNGLFLQIIRSYAQLMAFAVPQAWETRTTRAQQESALRHHRELAEAIAARDPEAAAAAMGTHFDTSIGDLLAARS